jgi:hypothetical protein
VVVTRFPAGRSLEADNVVCDRSPVDRVARMTDAVPRHRIIVDAPRFRACDRVAIDRRTIAHDTFGARQSHGEQTCPCARARNADTPAIDADRARRTRVKH